MPTGPFRDLNNSPATASASTEQYSTLTPAPTPAPASRPPSAVDGRRRSGREPQSTRSTKVTVALIHYLEAVAAALNRWGVAVAGVHTTTAELGLLSGRIQLARQRARQRAAVELRWTETTGWEVMLRPTREDAVNPWRFLHADLTPHPDHVASFAHGLLHGQDLGMSYPASFRNAGEDLPALTTRLTHAARTTTHPGRRNRQAGPPPGHTRA